MENSASYYGVIHTINIRKRANLDITTKATILSKPNQQAEGSFQAWQEAKVIIFPFAHSHVDK